MLGKDAPPLLLRHWTRHICRVQPVKLLPCQTKALQRSSVNNISKRRSCT